MRVPGLAALAAVAKDQGRPSADVKTKSIFLGTRLQTLKTQMSCPIHGGAAEARPRIKSVLALVPQPDVQTHRRPSVAGTKEGTPVKPLLATPQHQTAELDYFSTDSNGNNFT